MSRGSQSRGSRSRGGSSGFRRAATEAADAASRSSRDGDEEPIELIESQSGFEALCDDIEDAGIVAFDTEFVSESSFRPELCLMQFSVGPDGEDAVGVDPFEVPDLSRWWEIMADARTTVIVHGGQAEVKFCLEALDRPPKLLIDVQLAEGLLSTTYPLGYDALVQRVLNVRNSSHQTRTDWRRRPLSADQIKYALRDAEYLPRVWAEQKARLRRKGRTRWAQNEFVQFVRRLTEDHRREPHERVTGLSKLGRKELAVAREVALWRDEEAARRNRPARKVLRDDLVVDLAKRSPDSREQLLAHRDMNRGDYRKAADDILAAIERGRAVSDDDLPERQRRGGPPKNPDEQALAQLLGIALTSLCNEHQVARQLVGTTADLRDLVRWHTAGRPGDPPKLAEGWRGEMCGDLLAGLLDGEVSLRVSDPASDHPLTFDRGEG